MLSIPTDCSSDSPVIAVVDSLTRLPDNVGFQSKVIEEDVKVLIIALCQSYDPIVQR